MGAQGHDQTRESSQPNTRRMPWARSSDPDIWIGLVWAVVISLIGYGATSLWRASWTNTASDQQVLPQASVMIGTFIPLYTVFIGGFGALAQFVTRAKGHGVVQAIAVIVLIEGTGLDLFQVLNSIGDLYATVTTGLTSYHLNDDAHDFLVYFSLNLGVAAVAVLVACLPDRDAGTGTVGSKWGSALLLRKGALVRRTRPDHGVRHGEPSSKSED